jgi:hypothetical protein
VTDMCNIVEWRCIPTITFGTASHFKILFVVML